ncbi:hypothetical protein DRQ33_02235 [bacterium]|nr:MAG: hypothetical protein DRQ33_02235 [bacterium]
MIDISKIDYKSPTFLKIVGTVVLFLLVLYLWNSMSYSANKKIIDEKQSELEKLKRELISAKGSAVKIEQIWAELNRLFTQYKLVEELLPRERDLTDFLKKIDLAVKQADAKLLKIEQKPSQNAGYYFQDPYEIRINTTFHGLGKFLSLVANLPFTALVKDVKIGKTGGEKFSITTSMTILAHHMETEQRITKIEELKVKRKTTKDKKKPKRKGEYKPS